MDEPATSPSVVPPGSALAAPENGAAASRAARSRRGLLGTIIDLVRLARPKQWVKGGFVLIGPAYGVADLAATPWQAVLLGVLGAFFAFGFTSSAGYVLNDLKDQDADRAHPRKRHRPIAAGRISPAAARVFAGALAILALAAVLVVPHDPDGAVGGWAASPRTLLGLCVLFYAVNAALYTAWLKASPVIDVVSLSLGFVLRVLGGCAAVGISPSAWLLSCTFFVSMFLALGKRLGERRTMGDSAAIARTVQAHYTDDFLRMSVVVTGVATLLSYSDYVVAQSPTYTLGFNLLWLTLLPATYGLLRCIVLIERGVYDDPTELATRDRPFQAAVVVFAVLTAALLVVFKLKWI